MRHRVLIVGGGTAGITTAAALRRKGVDDIAVIEPSETHYYQPLWTLVGAGVVAREATARPEASVLPKGVHWIRDRAKAFDPAATPHVSSVHDYERSIETWQMLRAVVSGHLLFTCPPMPIKCAGAPQKIAYMAADHLQRVGRRARCEVSYATALPVRASPHRPFRSTRCASATRCGCSSATRCPGRTGT